VLAAGIGLTPVKTADLKKALAALHKGELKCPLTIGELARNGLQHCAGELLHGLRKLDERGIRAVLVAVLAERLSGDAAKAPG